ncbi:MAG: hypothetical protein HOV81_25515 [Kofleriaceae bacterium]|nr:hypothetical protein [Kofleriaceae bacterium]
MTDIKDEEIEWFEANAAEQDADIRRAGWDFWLDMRDDAEANEFRRGAQECREMMARFVEGQGLADIAASIRANWNPQWGADPGRPR